MELLLGIDIGTSACKVSLTRRDGKIISDASETYAVYYPKAGYAEQDPDEWWKAVCSSVKRCIEASGCSPSDIAGIGIDGQSWSAIPVDRDGNVLTRTPIWMDHRSETQCEDIRRRVGEDVLFGLCGNPLTSPYTTGKILWFRDEMPDVYAHTYKILQSNSFIAYRLTGVLSHDVSQGYGIHGFDMKKGVWNEDVLQKIGIPSGVLPDLYSCHSIIGRVTEKAAGECGLISGIPVVAGGVDSACAALGSGALNNGETQEQGGQSGGMSVSTDEFRSDPRLILCSHVVPGKWLLQGGTTGGGGVMRWITREFAAYEREHSAEIGKGAMAQLDDMAAGVSAGSDGLVFLPYMAGERTPIWDSKAKGVFYGMDFSKTKGHFVRAAMEGVAFSLRHNLETAESAGASVSLLRATGGSANSRLWTQMKADITGKPITVPGSDNSTNLGAALLAGVGVGLYNSFDEAVSEAVRVTRRHDPDPAVKEAYDKNYGIYLELYEKLKDTMHKD